MIARRVTMLGDSLTAGYGLRTDQSLPVRLQAELERLGHPVRVANAGVSGDTTADGLRRMDRAVPQTTELCLVALGANDMMQKIAPEQVRANLDAIVSRLSGRGIPSLICGMRAPPWFGSYALAFDAVFADVARAHDARLYPFLLEGIALDPAYVLADRIHPNAAGIERIANRLAPHVAHVLGEIRPRTLDRGKFRPLP
jgi:acyl-CoA thioesterase-1